jgi:putative transcriptional regulator
MTAREIEEIRQLFKVSQTEFAKILRVSFATVNRWENGKATPDKETEEHLKVLKKLGERKDADREKILETVQTVGLGSAVTLAAAAGLVVSRTFPFLLGPLVGAALALGATAFSSLFVKNLTNEEEKKPEMKKSSVRASPTEN